MNLRLGDLHIGKVDAKHEFLDPIEERDKLAFDAFLMPEGIKSERLHSGDIYYVAGFRGTGKTSLLRWHAEDRRKTGCLTEFVLFKTGLNETQRLHLSVEVGISWTDVDARRMEVSQNFKEAWVWFILHKFGEIIKNNPSCIALEDVSKVSRLLRLLSLEDDSAFAKAMGFMPKLEGAKIKIGAHVGFFSAELGGDFKKGNGESGETSLDALNSKIISLLLKIQFLNPIFIYFDELEVFFDTEDQTHRDQRLVRDLLFAVDQLNVSFYKTNRPLSILAAVRSEVLDAMGALGQEVDRLVHDRGFHISWHHTNRSTTHPLMEMVRQKLIASEQSQGLKPDQHVFNRYFPARVEGVSTDTFLLDKSFYKPRDIVWRLSLAQKLFANETKFSERILHDTEIEYSRKLWDEVRYELSAMYSNTEIDNIEAALAGGPVSFLFDQIKQRFIQRAEFASIFSKLLNRRSVSEILADLYRLGAIGNNFRSGSSGAQIRSRWAFRGETTLLLDK